MYTAIIVVRALLPPRPLFQSGVLFAWFCLGHDLHPLDGLSGSGVSSWGNGGVAAEQTLKRKGEGLIPAFAQVLEGARLLAWCSVSVTAGSGLGRALTAFFYCSLREGPGASTPRRGEAGRQRLRHGWRDLALRLLFFCQLGWPVAWFKFAKVIWSGLPAVQPCKGPLKPLPCHLPLPVWLDAVKSPQ